MNRNRFVQLAAAAGATAITVPALVLADDLKKVRVATLISDTAGEALYAKDTGAFARAGLDVDLTVFTNYGAVQSALVSQAVDIGILDAMGFGITASHGISIEIIAAGAKYNTKAPTLALCVAKNSPIKRPQDLAGKIIAVGTLKSSADICMRAWLNQQHVDTSAIRVIEVPFFEMAAALERGTVDAATLVEPGLSAARDRVRRLGSIYDAVAPHYVQNVWATAPQYTTQNPDIVKRFVKCIYDVARWANAHHPETAAILVKDAKLEESAARDMTRTEYATSLDAKQLQPVMDILYASKSVPAQMNVATFIAPLFR